MFPDVKNATDKSFVLCISGMEFAQNLYDVTLELNFGVILQEISEAFPERTFAEEKKAVSYLNMSIHSAATYLLKMLVLC